MQQKNAMVKIRAECDMITDNLKAAEAKHIKQ